MIKYRFLENIATADIAFEAFGENLDEVFENSAEALTAVMVDPKDVKSLKDHELKIKKKGIEELLFVFLSELVFLKDAKQLLFSKIKIKIKKLTTRDYQLKANMWGEKINPKKHHLRSDVKAVTWHMFKLEKKREGWYAQIILDI